MDPKVKITRVSNLLSVRSEDYNSLFFSDTGVFMRCGKTKEDNPLMCPWGPEIADIEVSTSCSNGCSFCTPPGTNVLTPDGPKAIESIKPGDTIYGISEKGIRKEQQVTKLYSRQVTESLIVIECQDGTILKLTSEHPLLTQRGWVKSGELVDTDEIISF